MARATTRRRFPATEAGEAVCDGAGGGGASMAGRMASKRLDLSARDFCHLRVAATRRAQWTEQKRPEPYERSCSFAQASHGMCGRARRTGPGRRETPGAARAAHLCLAPTFLAHVAEQKRPEPYVPGCEVAQPSHWRGGSDGGGGGGGGDEKAGGSGGGGDDGMAVAERRGRGPRTTGSGARSTLACGTAHYRSSRAAMLQTACKDLHQICPSICQPQRLRPSPVAYQKKVPKNSKNTWSWGGSIPRPSVCKTDAL